MSDIGLGPRDSETKGSSRTLQSYKKTNKQVSYSGIAMILHPSCISKLLVEIFI